MPSIGWMSRAVLSAVVLTAAGCYSGAPPPEATDAPLATGAPEASPDPAACPNFVEVVETGPIVGGEEITEDGPLAQEQGRLEADMIAVQEYIRGHRDEFASIRWENGPRVRIVVGFVAHIDEHCAALRAVVRYPDEFEIIRQPQTEDRLEDIQGEIVRRYGDQLLGVGIGAGTIDVELRATGEAAADQIRLTYGDVVSIQVGLLPYPDRFASGPDCGPGQDVAAGSPLVATVTLDSSSVRSGEDFHGSVRVTNAGTATIAFETGYDAVASVFLPGSMRRVGFSVGGGSEMATGAVLAPGDHLDLDVVGGTASCDPDLGYSLPPGRYDVRIPVERFENAGGPDLKVTWILSDALPLTVTP